MARTSTLDPRGPFSLAAGTRFLEGFTAAATAAREDDHLHRACCLEGSWTPVAVCVRQDCDDGPVAVRTEVGIREHDAAIVQVRRILSLDVDGSGFAAVGERDPVVGELQSRYPGLRPVLFWSPYEAACWAVIAQRIRMVQAATIKADLTAEHGHEVEVCGERWHAFPSPARLAEVAARCGCRR